MNPEMEIFINRLASALGNGFYQGLLLAGVVWISLKIASRTNAATRYAAGLMALLLVAALPVVHFFLPEAINANARFRQWIGGRDLLVSAHDQDLKFEKARPLPIGVESSSVDENLTGSGNILQESPKHVDRRITILLSMERGNSFMGYAPRSTVSSHERFDAMSTGEIAADIESNTSRINPTKPPIGNVRPHEKSVHAAKVPGPHYKETNRQKAELPSKNLEFNSLSGENGLTGESFVNPAMFTALSAFRWQPSLPKSVVFTLCGLWIGISGFRWIGLLMQYALLFRMKKRSEEVSGDLEARFDGLRNEMDVRRNVRLRATSELEVPVAAGFFHPAVLLPAKLLDQTDAPGLEGILRHELAHLKRRDDWTNLIQQFIQAAFFFHPAVRWLAQRLTIDREIACDDHVLSAMRRPRDYALFLTEFAGRTKCRDWNVAPAAWSKTSQLKERIDMILDTQRNTSTRLAGTRTGALAAAALLTATLGFMSGPRLAIAKDPIDLETSSKSSKEKEVVSNDATEDWTAPVVFHGSKSDSEISATVSRKRTDGFPVVSKKAIVIGQSDSGPRPKLGSPFRKGLPDPERPVIAPIQPTLPFVAQTGSDCDDVNPFANLPLPPDLPHLPVLAQVGPHDSRWSSHIDARVERELERRPHIEARVERGLERRLQRLEEMVQSLVARDSRSSNSAPALSGSERNRKNKSKRLHEDLNHDDIFDRAEGRLAHNEKKDHDLDLDFDFDFDFDPDTFGELASQFRHKALRAAELAARQADRAIRETQRSELRLLERHSDEVPHGEHQIEVRRHLLEVQRKALEQQIQNMEKQMDKLSEELEGMDEQVEELESKSTPITGLED